MYTDDYGRTIIIDLKVESGLLTLCNVYLPTKNHDKDQMVIWQNIINNLAGFESENIIIGVILMYTYLI